MSEQYHKVFKITEMELMSIVFPHQVILRLLKKKGAPIKGLFFLEADLDYNWHQTADGNGTLYFEVTKP